MTSGSSIHEMIVAPPPQRLQIVDMETIEALNLALENHPGTLIFISHDRDFVSSPATRIIEMTPTGIVDFNGSYAEHLRTQLPNDKTRAA